MAKTFMSGFQMKHANGGIQNPTHASLNYEVRPSQKERRIHLTCTVLHLDALTWPLSLSRYIHSGSIISNVGVRPTFYFIQHSIA